MVRFRSSGSIAAFISGCSVALALIAPWAACAQTYPAAASAASGGASVGVGAFVTQADPAGAPRVYGDVRSPNRLSIVQLCNPNNRRCTLAFVDTREGDDAASLVRDYYRRTGGEATPNVTTQATCAGGWIARISAEQGTVAGGGILRGQALVCGYVSAPAALRALLDACDLQIPGGCRQANHVNVAWGYWDGLTPNGSVTEPGRPYEAATHTQGQSCDSALPLVESPACTGSAAVLLRAAGLP